MKDQQLSCWKRKSAHKNIEVIYIALKMISNYLELPGVSWYLFSQEAVVEVWQGLNTLGDNPTEWSNTLKEFVGCCRRIVWLCLTTNKYTFLRHKYELPTRCICEAKPRTSSLTLRRLSKIHLGAFERSFNNASINPPISKSKDAVTCAISLWKPTVVIAYFDGITTKSVYIWPYLDSSQIFMQERKNTYAVVIGFVKLCFFFFENWGILVFFFYSWETLNWIVRY